MPYCWVQSTGDDQFVFLTDTATGHSCRDGSGFDTEIWFWEGDS